MSFRLRVLGLVSLVAVTAVGATAYLAFRQASRQVTESAAADRNTVTRVVNELAGYARRHGTWEGLPPTVLALTRATGQRIRLVTEAGVVVVDSDTLEHRTARPVTAPPTLVDARPKLTLPAPTLHRALPPDQTPSAGAVSTPPVTGTPGVARESGRPVTTWDQLALTLREIQQYRSGVRLAACLSRAGLGATVSSSAYGVPIYRPDPASRRRDPGGVARCDVVARTVDRLSSQQDHVAICGKLLTAVASCLQGAFTAETDDLAPVPLRVYLGAVGDAKPTLTPGPVIAAAALVALLALVGTALLSRRVLRPIGTLTAAAHRLGAGDLSLRVPAAGRDELAQLARTFNRMADSLQRGEERQRRLVADVAHELRTPLANLRGYLEALKDGVLPTSPELFASLHEEAVLQQRIVDDLQDLALAEAGTLAYHITAVDLAELLETCRTAQQARADSAGVTLRVHAAGPVVVPADPDRLRQVVGNLVANALKATPVGGTVTLSADGPTAGWATVAVRDTGVGIPAADLPHVFDRFWRADPARGRSTGGSGLGLAIAKQIVSGHGGQISATSEPGHGTTVAITLPVDRRRTG